MPAAGAAAELIAQYTEYCALLRVRKPCSAVLEALRELHRQQCAAREGAAAAASTVADAVAVTSEDEEASASGSPVVPAAPDAPAAARRPPSLRRLDLSKAYLGGRGLLAVAALARHLPDLELLDVSDAQWFNCDGRPNAPEGHETATLFCQLLMGHPRLATLVIGRVDFGPSQYLWLVELLRGTPALTAVRLEAPNLEPHELSMLEALATVNAKRLERRHAGAPAAPARAGADSDDEPAADDDAAAEGGGGGTAESFEDSASDMGRSSTKSMLGLALARSVIASHMATRGGAAGSVEGVLRGVGEPTASMLVGPAVGHARKLAANPVPPAKTPEEAAALAAAFDRNGILRHVHADDRAAVVASMRRALYDDGAIILEQGDLVDGVGILTAGGAVSTRSDDVSMHHPCHSTLGEEELMPGMLADTRRFTTRAQTSLVSQPLRLTIRDRETARHRRNTQVYAEAESSAVLPGVSIADAKDGEPGNGFDDQPSADEPPERVEVWWLPRHVFKSLCVRPAHEHRQHWRRLIELLPCLQGLGTMAKLAVADALDERRATGGEVLSAGFAMLSDVFIVVDGSATVYFQHTQLKKLVRGEMFACHPKTDVARCSVVANAPSVVVAFIPPALFRGLPLHVQEHVASLARTFTLMDDPGS